MQQRYVPILASMNCGDRSSALPSATQISAIPPWSIHSGPDQAGSQQDEAIMQRFCVSRFGRTIARLLANTQQDDSQSSSLRRCWSRPESSFQSSTGLFPVRELLSLPFRIQLEAGRSFRAISCCRAWCWCAYALHWLAYAPACLTVALTRHTYLCLGWTAD